MGVFKKAMDHIDQIVREEVDEPRQRDELRQRREAKAAEKKDKK